MPKSTKMADITVLLSFSELEMETLAPQLEAIPMSGDNHNYLEKLFGRRFDDDKGEPYLSASFNQFEDYGPITKYLLESMQPIPKPYSKQLFTITAKLIRDFQHAMDHRRIPIDIRYQGAIQTNTQVDPYGELEVMVILQPRNKERASKSVEKLGTALMGVLTESQLFAKVDFSNKLNVHVLTKYPKAELTILPTIWIDTQVYKESRREIDRGIAEYDFLNKTRRSYLPFRNIARINYKDAKTNGNLKKLIRLVRSIQLDAEEPIHLNHYEVACTLFNIREKKLDIDSAYILNLLPRISQYLDKMVRFNMYRRVISPSRKELVFGDRKEKGAELLKLKHAIDEVIAALKDELRSSGRTIESRLPY